MAEDYKWRPSGLGDNDNLDYEYLSRLYICGSIYEKVDKEIEMILPSLELRSASLAMESGGTEYGVNGSEVRDVIETLQRKSATGKEIRSLLPQCPQRTSLTPLDVRRRLVWKWWTDCSAKVRPRCYGPSKKA